ncbi:MAG: ABC-2 family transporter protein [Ktedonobacteraceae bacterium]
MLRFYIEVARTTFRRQLIYRWANLAGLLTNIFFGSIFSYVIIALFYTHSAVAGYNVRDTLRYTWLVQSMIMIVLGFGWYDLMLTIRSGAVISDLSKPCDFYWYWFSREFGRNIYYLFYRGLPTYLAGMLLFGFGVPGDWRSWLAFILSLLLGATVGIAYRVLYNAVAFWFLEARAIGTLWVVVALFFTGSYVPIPFFPSWLLTIANWLPFNALMNVPAEILLGKVTGSTILFELVRQAIWVVLLTLLVRSIIAIAGRRVIVQGG